MSSSIRVVSLSMASSSPGRSPCELIGSRSLGVSAKLYFPSDSPEPQVATTARCGIASTGCTLGQINSREDCVTDQMAKTTEPSGRRILSLAAGALFTSNALFALGGIAGYEHGVAFGLLYLLSAAVAIPMIYLLVVAVGGRGATLTVLGAVLLGVAGVGHAAEAVLVLAGRVQPAGNAGALLGVAEFIALVAGMLLLAAGLWRARITSIWPGLLFLLVLPISRAAPHGLAQQSARSAILVIVTAWLSYALLVSKRGANAPASAPDERSTI